MKTELARIPTFFGVMLMDGVDPYGYLQRISRGLNSQTDRRCLERILDELEYLFDVMDPEVQNTAEQLMTAVREKLQAHA